MLLAIAYRLDGPTAALRAHLVAALSALLFVVAGGIVSVAIAAAVIAILPALLKVAGAAVVIALYAAATKPRPRR